MILLKIFSKTKWLLLAFLFCENIALSAQDLDLENYFYLSQWEINLGQGWQKTNAISWQTGPAQGGIGATQHHGFGVYRTRFNIPPNFRNIVLAFSPVASNTNMAV